jgi:hypothetical protein
MKSDTENHDRRHPQTDFEKRSMSVQKFKETLELCPHNSGDWLVEIRSLDSWGRQGTFHRFVAPWKKASKAALAVIDAQPSSWDTRISCCLVSWNRNRENNPSIRKQLILFLESNSKLYDSKNSE